MQDRFRYRVWDKEKDKWLYFDFSTYPTYENRIWQALTDGETFYQCTGLKDKNGKLIYEGDIVRLKAKNGMTFDYAVKFKNYCFILEYINGKLKGTKARDFAKQYAQPQKMYEHGYMVIGNIYENHELLED